MYFDREALGNGVTVYSQVSNGKAKMEITAYLADEGKQEAETLVRDFLTVEFRVTDCEERTLAVICAPAQNIVTVCTMLIYPHLWNGVEDPYLYHISVFLLKGEKILDEAAVYHGIRSFSQLPLRGFALNEKPFTMKAVRYQLPAQMSGSALYQEQLRHDLEIAVKLGANTICPKTPSQDPYFYLLCDTLGLLVWQEVTHENAIPTLADSAGDSLLTPDRRRKRDLFYYYQACWSSKPFVYLCGHENFSRNQDTVKIIAYSNQKKVALYVDGILFEFKHGAPEFVFEDVPLKRGETVISALAGECYVSMTLQKSHMTS